MSEGESSSSESPGRVMAGPRACGAILALRRSERAFFVHGFAKSARENLRRAELGALRALAEEILGLDDAGINASLANRRISAPICDDQAMR